MPENSAVELFARLVEVNRGDHHQGGVIMQLRIAELIDACEQMGLQISWGQIGSGAGGIQQAGFAKLLAVGTHGLRDAVGEQEEPIARSQTSDPVFILPARKDSYTAPPSLNCSATPEARTTIGGRWPALVYCTVCWLRVKDPIEQRNKLVVGQVAAQHAADFAAQPCRGRQFRSICTHRGLHARHEKGR